MRNLTMPKTLLEYMENDKPTSIVVGIIKIVSVLISCGVCISLINSVSLCICWCLLCVVTVGFMVVEMLPTIPLLWVYRCRIISHALFIFAYIAFETGVFIAMICNKTYPDITLTFPVYVIAGTVSLYFIWNARVFGDDTSRLKALVKLLKREESYHQKIWGCSIAILLQIIGIVIWRSTGVLPTLFLWGYIYYMLDICVVAMLKIQAIKYI